MPYEWSQLEQIFDDCLNLPVSERENHIRAKAGDNQKLKETLLSMLAKSGEEENFFQNLQGGIAKALHYNENVKEAFEAGDVIGKYKIQSLLDKGGMGEVYLATRDDGQFEQNVAIKCFPNIKINHKSLERFRQEQQFLATLNHGNIAHIIDGGTANDIPYIIMDFVEGKPIDQYLKSKIFSEKQTLQLFIDICETIQFAHNHLILHLDIKPNNILVSNEGKLKLLDFGISRKTDQVSGIADNLMATPLFSAPEQLKSEPVSIATDVYQLGVLLHLLLAGEIPYKVNQDIHLFREIQINRKLIQPELQAIILKCLQKNPTERYISANELLTEIKRYNTNYAVAVYSQSLIYKSTKFLQRNKASAFLSLTVAISLLLGVFSYKRQATIAKQETIKAELAAEKSEQVSQFLISIFESANPELSGTEMVQIEDVFQETVNKINFYPDDPLKAELLSVLGTTLSKAGKYELADTVLSKAIQLFEKVDAISSENYYLTYNELSKSRMYNSQFEASISIVKSGMNKFFSNSNKNKQISGILNLQYALATMEAGNIDMADSIFNESKTLIDEFSNPLRKAEAYNVKASILSYKGDFDSSILYLNKSIAIVENNYSPQHTYYLTLSENLASAYRQQGKLEKALKIKQETVMQTEKIFGKKHLEYIKSANGIALIYKDLGQLEFASQYLHEAVLLTKELLGESTLAYISSTGNLALVLSDQSKFSEAEKFAKQAYENGKQLLGLEHPFYLWSLGIYAEALAKNQKLKEAESNFILAIDEQTRIMGKDHPWTRKSVKGLADLYKRKGWQQKADSILVQYD